MKTTCPQIPEKNQSYIKGGGHNVDSIKIEDSTLDFFQKEVGLKFELLNSGYGLPASVAYLRVFTLPNKKVPDVWKQ